MNRREFFKGMVDTTMRAADLSVEETSTADSIGNKNLGFGQTDAQRDVPTNRAGSVGTRFCASDGENSMRVTPGSPRQYAPGTRVLITVSLAWLCCDDLGFYAIDAHCPHLGGIVQATEDGYACPCHDSRFDAAGEVTSGPPKRGLQYLYVDLDKDGNLVIRRDRQAGPDDRLIA